MQPVKCIAQELVLYNITLSICGDVSSIVELIYS